MNSKKTQKNAFLGTVILIIGLLLVTGCRRKEGCPSMNQHVKAGKNGELPMKRGKTGLFPKNMK
jgi:hypothetical protein